MLAARAPGAAAAATDRGDSRARAAELGLQPFRLPEPFPFDSELAMRVATYAKSIGRAVAFSQAAFRQAYAGGHSLADENFVLITAAACEMHPRAVLQAARSASHRRAAARRDGARRRARRQCPCPQSALPAGNCTAGRRRWSGGGPERRGVSASRDYRLTVTRGGIAPVLLADPARVDHVELVEIASGEVVLFWDCTPGTGDRPGTGDLRATCRASSAASSWPAGLRCEA